MDIISYYNTLEHIFETESGKNKVIYPKDLHTLSNKERAMLKDDDFALPKQRKYPIHDLNHAKLALEYVHKIDKLDIDKINVEHAVYKRYPQLNPSSL